MEKIWNNAKIDQKIKLRLYIAIMLPTALHASETYKITAAISKKLNVFHQRCLRKILKISYRDHVTNDVLQRAKSRRLQDIVTERRLRLAGHILRLPDTRHAKIAFRWEPPGGKRKRERPRTTWCRSFKEELKVISRSWNNLEREAADRKRWKMLSAQCATIHGRT